MKLLMMNAYLYSLWSGEFKVYEGDVYESIYGDIRGAFKTGLKKFRCSNKPVVVYNSTVWLPNRNDNFAKTILIEHENAEIDKLRKKIDDRLTRVLILENNRVNEKGSEIDKLRKKIDNRLTRILILENNNLNEKGEGYMGVTVELIDRDGGRIKSFKNNLTNLIEVEIFDSRTEKPQVVLIDPKNENDMNWLRGIYLPIHLELLLGNI